MRYYGKVYHVQRVFGYGIELFSLYIEDLRNRDKREVWITDREFAGDRNPQKNK